MDIMGWGDDDWILEGFGGGGLNSIGALNAPTLDLDRIFTKDGLCSGCSTPLEIEEKEKIRIGWCKKCGKTFTNVVPTAGGMRLIDEMIEFNDLII